MRMKKVAGVFYFLVFLCMLIVPLATINTEHNVMSEADNRMLTEFPQSREMFATYFKSYLEDRIGFRKEMMLGYIALNQIAFGELEHPLYEFGKDGYVFFKMHDNIQFSEYHRLFADSVVKMKEYCEQRGVPFIFLFDPEKSSVYRRYLPEGFSYDDSWVDQLLAYLEERGVDCVNNKELLIEKSYEEQVFNRQYDAGHWSGIGAYYGTNNLWKHMNKDFPAVTEYTPDDFVIDSKIAEYYPASVIPVNEEIPVYILKKDWEWITDKYADEIELNPSYRYFQYSTDTSDEAEKLPRVMVFHGSYYNEKPSFLIGKVREYIGIHDYQNVLNLDYYFNVFQPEAVVFEVAEYTLEDSYFSQEKMEILEFNPGISPDEAERILSLTKEPESMALDGTSLSVLPGEMIDKITWMNPEQMDYVYLLSDGKVFDLLKNDEGKYYAAISHDSVGKDAMICCRNKDGEEIYYEVVYFSAVEKGTESI